MFLTFLDELLHAAFHENATPKYKVFEAIPHNDCSQMRSPIIRQTLPIEEAGATSLPAKF